MLCLTSYLLAQLTAHKDYARINVKPAGERQDMGWGFKDFKDLKSVKDVFCDI